MAKSQIEGQLYPRVAKLAQSIEGNPAMKRAIKAALKAMKVRAGKR